MSDGLTIGQLAAAAGVGRETIRYYERRGILAPPPRSASGYRSYPADTVERLRFVKRAQELGFTLSEVSELLSLRITESEPCATVEAQARDRLRSVNTKVTDLLRIEAALNRLVEKCQANEATGDCPILDELTATGAS